MAKSNISFADAVALLDNLRTKVPAQVAKAPRAPRKVAPVEVVAPAPIVKRAPRKVAAVQVAAPAPVAKRAPKANVEKFVINANRTKDVDLIPCTAAQRKLAAKLLKELGGAPRGIIDRGQEYDRAASRARTTAWFDRNEDKPAANGVYQMSLDGDRATCFFAKWDGKKWETLEGKRIPFAQANCWRGLTQQGYAVYLDQLASGKRQLIAV